MQTAARCVGRHSIKMPHGDRSAARMQVAGCLLSCNSLPMRHASDSHLQVLSFRNRTRQDGRRRAASCACGGEADGRNRPAVTIQQQPFLNHAL